MAKVYYKEEQKFGQPWIWMIFVPVNVAALSFFAFGFNEQLLKGNSFGDSPMSDTGLIIVGLFTIILTIGLTVLFYKMKLVTEIRSDGLYYRFPPLFSKFRKIARDEIQQAEIREYKPIKEYGGWGIKTGVKKFGKAYNVRGKIGLQLYLRNGDKVLFGTQRKFAMGDAASKMMNSEALTPHNN